MGSWRECSFGEHRALSQLPFPSLNQMPPLKSPGTYILPCPAARPLSSTHTTSNHIRRLTLASSRKLSFLGFNDIKFSWISSKPVSTAPPSLLDNPLIVPRANPRQIPNVVISHRSVVSNPLGTHWLAPCTSQQSVIWPLLPVLPLQSQFPIELPDALIKIDKSTQSLPSLKHSSAYPLQVG